MSTAMTELQVVLAVLSGGIVGFTLGLLGGGGSIMAVPLLLYVVGLRNTHVVIGSTALAVAVNAYLSMIYHWRERHVNVKAAIAFAIPGVAGAFVGAEAGKLVPDKQLLFLFAILMIVVALWMLRTKKINNDGEKQEIVHLRMGRVLGTGFTVGAISGFFGIGGGFLIVPGLIFATGMSMIQAIGTSLFSVGTFGLTTAIDYAASGLINVWVVVEYVAGGVVGGYLGTLLAKRLSRQKRALNIVFSVIIILVAVYMLYVNWVALH